MDISPLIQLLKNPQGPTFNQAVAKLAELNTATLRPEDVPLLLAQVESAIAVLQKSRDATAQELEKLRAQSRALHSYQKPGK